MKAMRAALILVGLCSLFCYSVAEADWFLYGDTVRGDKFYYDSDSLYLSKEGVVTVMTKILYGKESVKILVAELGEKYAALQNGRLLLAIDCSNKMAKTVSRNDYDSGGALIKSFDKPTSWEPIEPGTGLDILRGLLCPPKG